MIHRFLQLILFSLNLILSTVSLAGEAFSEEKALSIDNVSDLMNVLRLPYAPIQANSPQIKLAIGGKTGIYRIESVTLTRKVETIMGGPESSIDVKTTTPEWKALADFPVKEIRLGKPRMANDDTPVLAVTLKSMQKNHYKKEPVQIVDSIAIRFFLKQFLSVLSDSKNKI